MSPTDLGGDGFEETAGAFESIANYFERERVDLISGSARDPETGQFVSPKEDKYNPKNRIQNAIRAVLNGMIVLDAQNLAKEYVGEKRAQSITGRTESWRRHYLVSRNDIVAYHEFGTSTQARDQSRATINAPGGGGYVIPLDGYDDIPYSPDDIPGLDEPLPFRYVVHPGVEQQGFMRKAIRGNRENIKDEIKRSLTEVDILD
jgi:hypothetical protein